MMSQIKGLVLSFMVGLVAFTRGEKYSAMVSENEEYNEKGECQRMVTIMGNGISDSLPVGCDMAEYQVTNEKQLVVGDKIYSDKVDTLMVLDKESCERRTYSDGALATTTHLQEDECLEVKLLIKKAYSSLIDDGNERSSSSDSSDSSDSSPDVSEDKITAYEDLKDWLSEDLESDEKPGIPPKDEDDNSKGDAW